MALTLLSFFTLAIAGFGACQAFTRRLALPTNALINLGLGFFVAMAVVGFVVSQNWAALSTVSLAILLMSCCGAAVTAGGFIRGSTPSLWARGSFNSRLAWFNAMCLCAVTGYLTLGLLNNMSSQVFPWDAFTTWMFRAKAWVTTDQAIDFVTLNEWLISESGFTLTAAHYPISVSAVAAFAAAVSGGWSDQAANIPWFFVLTAGALIVAGLCRLQSPNSPIAAPLGAALLVTAPLVHWHGLLAGYADIWVMGTSGMGLAGICLWTQRNAHATLAISLVLLALGCLWKSEGWLWLMLGCWVALMCSVWRRWTLRGAAVMVLVAVALRFAQPVDLGALGRWGMTESALYAGAFGVFEARLYNPAPAFLDMSILQGSFLLLIPLYAIALVTLLIRECRDHLGYLLMALCLMAAHGVIFGLSGYSLYAETGTALNRLLLQNVPVLIVTITAALHAIAPLSDLMKQGPATSRLTTPDPTINPTATSSATNNLATAHAAIGTEKLRIVQPVAVASSLLVMALAVALPLTLVLSSWDPPQTATTNVRTVSAGELRAVIGRLEQSQQGFKFRGDNIPVGVAAIPLLRSNAVQPRYLVSQSWMQAPEKLSFYWINNDEPRVHSTPLPLSGRSVLDMSAYEDFWQRPITEMGFLVKPEHFNQAAIGSVTLTNSLRDAIPALIHHWMTPAPLSHRIINATTGHLAAPVALQRVLVTALMLMVALGLAWWWLAPASRTKVAGGMLLAVSGLWLLGSTAHLNQVFALLRDAPAGADTPAESAKLEAAHLIPLVTWIQDEPIVALKPLLTASLDPLSQLEAQRLPFMVLPTSAATIDASALTQVVPDFSGTVVLLGKNAPQLRKKAAELAQISLLRARQSGEGYVLLSSEDE